MTAALLDMMATLVPGAALDAVPGQFVRFFVGERVAQILGLPEYGEGPFVRALRALGHAGDVAGDHSLPVQALARRFSGLLIDGMMLVNRGGQRLPFNNPHGAASGVRRQLALNCICEPHSRGPADTRSKVRGRCKPLMNYQSWRGGRSRSPRTSFRDPGPGGAKPRVARLTPPTAPAPRPLGAWKP